MIYDNQKLHAILIVIPAFILLMLLCIAQVSAAEISITTTGNLNDMELKPGQTNSDTRGFLTVSCDDPFGYTIEVIDPMTGKGGNNAGKMVETTDGTTYVTPDPKVLGSPMSVDVPDDAGYSHASKTISDSTSSGFISSAVGHQVVSDKLITLTFSQPVSFADTVLTAGHTYRIVVEFDAALKTS